jgi:spermidine synthase
MERAERPFRRPLGTASGDPVLHEDDGALSLYFDTGALQSRMLRADPTRLVLEYTRLMMGFLLFHPAPARIAMIGLGGGSLAKYCALRLPEADFTAIEISPDVIALRDAFGIPPDGPRFRVLCEDGAAFVRRNAEPIDVLLVDGFDGGGQPDALCTAAFYDCCRDRLATGGILVANLYADDEAPGGRVDRIDDAFAGRIVVIPADGSGNNVVFAGTDASFPPPFGQLVERLRALQGAHPVALDVTVRKALQHGAQRTVNRGRRRRGVA